MVIITDSTSDMPFEEAVRLGVTMLPMTVRFGKEEFIDKVTITSEMFYKKLAQCDTPPKTSLVSSGRFLDEYEKHENEPIVVITISSTLSGTYNAAVTACDITGRNDIFIVDSRSVSVGLLVLVHEAVRMRDEGVEAAEIYEKLLKLREKTRVVAVIDTMKYLVMGGRISGFVGHIGTLLNLKPLVCIDGTGVIKNIGKARGTQNALQKLKEEVFEAHTLNPKKPYLYVHGGNIEAVKQLETLIGKKAEAYSLGSVVAAHAGPGAVGIGYIEK